MELAKENAEETESKTSARNAMPGIVTRVILGDVTAQVEIQAGPHRVVPLLTREAVEELGLEPGVSATARVESTSVHIDVGWPPAGPRERTMPRLPVSCRAGRT